MMGRDFTSGMVLDEKYRIEEVLGRGGMGTVLRARHVTLGECVAIKTLSAELGRTPDLFARFVREAQAAAKLKSPHVARVVDIARLEDGTPYMVMELLDGHDLAWTLKTHGPLEPGLAVDLILQACEVLAEAHAMGIVHRDIKPSNLFVTRDATDTPFLKVLDFGIAKAPTANGDRITRVSSVLGTPGYMSPEQLLASSDVDHRADIWALGLVMYELVEGRRAFVGDNVPDLYVKITSDPPAPMRRAPRALGSVISRCLEKDAEARFENIEDLAEALASCASDPSRARDRLDRIHSLAKAGARRSEAQLPQPARGRLDATADAASPAPPSAPPTAPARPNATPKTAFASTEPSPAPAPAPQLSHEVTVPRGQIERAAPAETASRGSARRIAVVAGIAAVVVAAGIVVASQVSRPAARATEPVAAPEPAPPARDAEPQAVAPDAPDAPVAPTDAGAQVVEAPPQHAPVPASPPRKPGRRKPLHAGSNAAAASPPPPPPPPPPTHPDAGTVGSAAPCDPFSRFGC